MLGSQQSKIIGILREEYEKDPKRFLSIKEIYDQLVAISDVEQPISYNSIAIILKRLSVQEKINFREVTNKNFYQYKDIQEQVLDRLLSTFIRAFGSTGIARLIEKSQNLTDKEMEELKKLIDDEK